MRVHMLAIALTLGLSGGAFAQARVMTVEEGAAAPTGSISSETQADQAAPSAAPPAAPSAAPEPAAPLAAPAAPAVVPPASQTATAPVPPPRFLFERAKDGFLRLDEQTGQVAYCSERAPGWTCQAVPEDRTALEKEIARQQDEISRHKAEIAGQQREMARQQNEIERLQTRVADLTREVAMLREPPPPPRPPADLSPPAESKDGDDKTSLTIKLPTQEDFDRATAALQHAWHRVVDMIGNLKKDLTRKVQPDRTTL